MGFLHEITKPVNNLTKGAKSVGSGIGDLFSSTGHSVESIGSGIGSGVESIGSGIGDLINSPLLIIGGVVVLLVLINK